MSGKTHPVIAFFLSSAIGLSISQADELLRISSVSSAMKSFVDQSEVAGVVSLIATDKEIVHFDAVGKADIADDKPMQLDSIFWIASMTKPITGACVMMMSDEGKLSLDDPITKHLPEMNALRSTDGKPVVITIRHLLTHTSGMSELKPEEAYTAKTLADVCQSYAKLPVQFEPGTAWKYSQTSINTAARIVEVVSGKSFDLFVEERLCRPLGMKDTTFYPTAEHVARLAKAYKKTDDKETVAGADKLVEEEIRILKGKSITDRDRFPPANGGLFSTAHDYWRFSRMLLNEGEFDGLRLLSREAVQTMRTIATGDLPAGFVPGSGWGIGCAVVREPSGVTSSLSPGTFGHGGAYGTQAWIDPIKKRIHILMIQRSNIGNSDGSELRRSLHDQAGVFLAQGCFAGEVETDSVLLQTRLTTSSDLNAEGDILGATGQAYFEWSTHDDFRDSKCSDWLTAAAEHDFIVRVKATDLKPATDYFYRVVFGRDKKLTEVGPIHRFKTLPGASIDRDVRFVMGSCMNYNKFMHGESGKASGPITASDDDKNRGFPALQAIGELQPDFFIGTGDIVYYDNVLNGPAQSLPELRQCWHEQFRFARLKHVFNNTASYWSKDDHDFRFNDSDLKGDKLPLPRTGIELFREQMPIHSLGDNTSPTYRTHRLNKHVQLWFSEGRDFRSPNKMKDGPEKSLWGSEQREWLKKSILASQARWKILITPTPMVGPDDASKTDNHTNLGGFRHEADEFFAWLGQNNIRNFCTFCGDRHWQYHSRHPSGVEEFACGALNDENSRMGVPPGSKKGTDPEAEIKQFYTYEEPTGGFIQVTAGETLRVEFRDDHGKILYQVEKTP